MTEAPSIKLDDMDLLLMRELENDGRQSIADLARKAGTTRTTVRNRLETLIEGNVLAIVGWVNPYALGYRFHAMIGLSVQHNQIDDVSEILQSYPFVQSAIVTTGQFDIMVWAFFYDQKHMVDFLKKDLGNVSAISDVETMIILEVKKAFTRLLSAPGEHQPPAPTLRTSKK